MFDVPGVIDQRDELEIHTQLQYRRAGAFGAAGFDLLFDLYCVAEIQGALIETDKSTD